MAVNNPNENVNKHESDFASLQEGQLQILKFLDKLERNQDNLKNVLEKFEVRIHDMEDMLFKTNSVELQRNQTEMMVAIRKITGEVDRIGHRTSWIKEVTTNAAAHTLNTARKIHGATSVLDPTKEFKRTGYRDWSIKPIYGQGSMPTFYGMQPMGYPNQAYSNGMQYAVPTQMQANNYTPSQGYSQNVNRTPVYGQMTPGYGNRTPGYQTYENRFGQAHTISNRTPAYVNQVYRTPVYEDQRTPTYSQAVRYNGQENQIHRSGTNRDTGRIGDSANNRHTQRNGKQNVANTGPAYEPESPVYH